jgi:hypothetical protein
MLLTVSLTIRRSLSSYLRCSIACCIIVVHISKSLRLESGLGVNPLYSLNCRELVFSETRIHHGGALCVGPGQRLVTLGGALYRVKVLRCICR